MTTSSRYFAATPEALAVHVEYAVDMLRLACPSLLRTTANIPADEQQEPHRLSHWRDMVDENGREYRISARVAGENAEGNRCRVRIEVGPIDAAAQITLVLDRDRDMMLLSALNVIAETIEEEGGVQ